MKARATLLPFLLALVLGQSTQAQDMAPPMLVGVGSADGLNVSLCFNEPIDPASGEDEFNYLVTDRSGLVEVSRVVLLQGGATASIVLSQPVIGEFTVELNSVTDLAGNEIAPQSKITGRVWTQFALADIGGVFPAGLVVGCQESQFAVVSGGDNIGGAADQFTYLSTTRTNNFDLSVRVDGLLFVGQATAKAGLVMRESLEADARMLALYATPTNGANYVQTRVRHLAGAAAVDLDTRGALDSFPIWLRLRRVGQTVTAFTSRDGLQWEPLGLPQTLSDFPAVAYIGLGTASRSPGIATTAEYGAFGETLLYPDAQYSITQQPGNVSAEAHTRATFEVRAAISGAPDSALEYQWQAESDVESGVFTNLFFAVDPVYQTPFLGEAQSDVRFRVLVSVNGHSAVISDVATLKVIPDVTAPRATFASGTRNRREIVIDFSEPLDRQAAQVTDHYRVDDFTVTSARLDESGTRVTLTLNGMQVIGGTNLVQISDLPDLAGHRIEPSPQSVIAPAFALSRGFASQELYFNAPGATMNDLRATPTFPDAPNEVGFVSSLEGPYDVYDNYGTRITGYLIPPVTGRYNFFICSDDQGEFWLSTDEEPANRVLLCREPSWMVYRNYTDSVALGETLRNASAPENRSSTLFPSGIPLVAGKSYYFEAVAKEGGGGDNLAVAWQPPGSPLPVNGSPPISGEFLATLAPRGGTVRIVEQPHDLVYTFDPPLGNSLHDETFATGNGGYSVINSSDPQSPWTYAAATGQWVVNGSGTLNRPSWSALVSPIIQVPRTQSLMLRLEHRYSFEPTYDGGQVRVSVNGSPFQAIAASSYCANGYRRGALIGNGILRGLEAFHEDSPDYASGAFISTTANLGSFRAGDTVQIQFLGAWDESVQSSLPNWAIDRVVVTEGECAKPATLSVVASASISGFEGAIAHYQWQRNCGQGFANIMDAKADTYSFVPVLSDLLCQFRCVVSTPGMSVTSSVVRVTIPPVSLQVQRVGTNVRIQWNAIGVLQQAQNINGPWALVSITPTNNATIRPTASARFYRVRIP